jgi:hypothetical protein
MSTPMNLLQELIDSEIERMTEWTFDKFLGSARLCPDDLLKIEPNRHLA